MSKHSKWAKIKRQKGVADVKKGNVFAKLGMAIAIAAKKGSDPETNFSLRLAIERARAVNMPNDTIERAIARGSGKLEGQIIEEVLYEGFGPLSVSIIIETATDNKNRTVADIKRVLQEYGGRLGGPNSVTWMFEHKGIITLDKTTYAPEKELALIDAGAEDIRSNDAITIIASPESCQTIEKVCTAQGIAVLETSVGWIPKEPLTIPEDKKEVVKRFFEAVDALDDVQKWYSNVNMDTL